MTTPPVRGYSLLDEVYGGYYGLYKDACDKTANLANDVLVAFNAAFPDIFNMGTRLPVATTGAGKTGKSADEQIPPAGTTIVPSSSSVA